MPSLTGRSRRFALGISLQEATFERRRFRPTSALRRQRLERIGYTFLHGYHAALEETDLDRLVLRLGETDTELSGFAFEGGAMGLAICDAFTPRRFRRFARFLEGPAAPHLYMVHVGVGWARARLGRLVDGTCAKLDPLLRWLAVDGLGFHQGYFHWHRFVERLASPPRLAGYGLRAFDQGLGRSLWFVNGADVAAAVAAIARFPATRRADLWSGLGLATAYAGGADRLDLERLRALAGSFSPAVAQGAAFAAKARQRAGNPAPHTGLACDVLCSVSADEAARITDSALDGLDRRIGEPEPAYEIWRQRIRSHFAQEIGVA